MRSITILIQRVKNNYKWAGLTVWTVANVQDPLSSDSVQGSRIDLAPLAIARWNGEDVIRL